MKRRTDVWGGPQRLRETTISFRERNGKPGFIDITYALNHKGKPKRMSTMGFSMIFTHLDPSKDFPNDKIIAFQTATGDRFFRLEEIADAAGIDAVPTFQIFRGDAQVDGNGSIGQEMN